MNFFRNLKAGKSQVIVTYGTSVTEYPNWKKLSDEDSKTFLTYAPDGLPPNKIGVLAIHWPNIEKMRLEAEAVASR